MSTKKDAVSYILLSIIAASLILTLVIMVSSDVRAISNPYRFLDRVLVGIAFISSCLFGISLALRPGWIGRLLKSGAGVHGSNRQMQQGEVRKRRGHHPDCERFEGHVITIRGKSHCAGCLGLSIGATLSIVLMILFIAVPFRLPNPVLFLLMVFGFGFVALGFAEIMLPVRSSKVHVTVNALFVVGFFLITMGAFELNGGLIHGLLVVVISFLWLETRIHISNWRHTIICKTCGEDCKVYLG